MSEEEVCQGCGKLIEWGDNVITVRYGRIKARVRHTAVTKERVDYFHANCPVGISDAHEYKHKKTQASKSEVE